MSRRANAIILGFFLGGLALRAAESVETPSPLERARVGVDRSVTAATLANALLAETNRVRRQHGCAPLRSNADLNAAAEDQASYMALLLSATHHNAINGQANVKERVNRHGFFSTTLAENVASQPAMNEGPPMSAANAAAKLVSAWMRSPGHRANLLNRQFTHFGCAARVAKGFGKIDYVFGVQVFSGPPTTMERHL